METKRMKPIEMCMHLYGHESKASIPQNIGEPVRIGRLLEPVRQAIDHPDRDRLLAEFFKDYQ